MLQRRVPQTDGQSQHLPSQHVTITPARTGRVNRNRTNVVFVGQVEIYRDKGGLNEV